MSIIPYLLGAIAWIGVRTAGTVGLIWSVYTIEHKVRIKLDPGYARQVAERDAKRAEQRQRIAALLADGGEGRRKSRRSRRKNKKG